MPRFVINVELAPRGVFDKNSRSMRRTFPIVLAALGAILAQPAAQSPSASRTLKGTLTVTTKGHTTAVLGRSPDPKQGDFMFCIDQDRSKPTAVAFTGPGRVVYQPDAAIQVPEGVTISGPEMVAPTLAVIGDDGKAWVFVGKGQQPPLPPGDPVLARATKVGVQGLRRTDWTRPNGTRGGLDVEGCLAPGG